VRSTDARSAQIGRPEGVARSFDALFSFNLRTPPSQGTTPSGKRIFALPIAGKQPDALVGFLRDAWQHRLALKQPQ